jgi:hypothetical protein
MHRKLKVTFYIDVSLLGVGTKIRLVKGDQTQKMSVTIYYRSRGKENVFGCTLSKAHDESILTPWLLCLSRQLISAGVLSDPHVNNTWGSWVPV